MRPRKARIRAGASEKVKPQVNHPSVIIRKTASVTGFHIEQEKKGEEGEVAAA